LGIVDAQFFTIPVHPRTSLPKSASGILSSFSHFLLCGLIQPVTFRSLGYPSRALPTAVVL
jgi:hypothetical protein